MKWVVLPIQNPSLANALVHSHSPTPPTLKINLVLRKETHLNHSSWEAPTLKVNSVQLVVSFVFILKEGFQEILSFIRRACCVDLYQIMSTFSCTQTPTAISLYLPTFPATFYLNQTWQLQLFIEHFLYCEKYCFLFLLNIFFRKLTTNIILEVKFKTCICEYLYLPILLFSISVLIDHWS